MPRFPKPNFARFHSVGLAAAVFLLVITSPQFGAGQCKCATFSVTTNLEEVQAGEIVQFEALGSGTTFNWSVSAGTIVSGQGTRKISVQTTEDLIKSVPTPTPSANLNDTFFSHPRRIRLKLTAEAVRIQGNCKCPTQSASVFVGFRTIPINTFANVIELRLSNSTLVHGCPPGIKPREGKPAPTSMIIDVETSAIDAENDVLTYDYKVTGGRIIGTGPKVKWDLSDAEHGTHTITAGVDDGCGLCGASKTQTITVLDGCEGCGFIECPEIKIYRPEHLTNESIFTANVSGGSQPVVTYEWSVVGGEIIEGQGSPSIKVKIHTRPGGSVTLKIGWSDSRGGCVDSTTLEFQ